MLVLFLWTARRVAFTSMARSRHLGHTEQRRIPSPDPECDTRGSPVLLLNQSTEAWEEPVTSTLPGCCSAGGPALNSDCRHRDVSVLSFVEVWVVGHRVLVRGYCGAGRKSASECAVCRQAGMASHSPPPRNAAIDRLRACRLIHEKTSEREIGRFCFSYVHASR